MSSSTTLTIRHVALVIATYCLLLTAPASVGQSLDALSKERSEIDSALAQHEERVSYLLDRIERTQEEVDEAATELAAQETSLSEAIATVEAEPSDINTRAATLASIRYNRSAAKLERLRERLDSAEAELASIKTHQTELTQRLLVITAQAQKAKTEAAKAAAAPTPAPAPVIAAPVAPATAAPAPAPASAPEPAPASAVAAHWPSPLDEAPANVAFAKQTLQRTAARAPGAAPLNNVKLNHNRGRGTETFDYLGDNLYRVDMQLEAGMWGFKIYNQTFWTSIPKEMADQKFVLIYDVTGQATLHVFRASALN